MICCKIITNEDGSFAELCKQLSKKGQWMWYNGYLYFADTEGDTNERVLLRTIKKAGYTKGFVEEYTKDKEPYEEDYLKGWIADKLAKIYYLKFERDNQKVLQETSAALIELTKEVDEIIMKAQEEKKTDTGKTEDNNNG